jgi:hypothetical protein
MALERVYSLRRRAASTMCWLLSARICGRLRLIGIGFQIGDDLLQVAQDLAVHLDHPRLAAGLCGGDDLQQLLALFVVLWHDSEVVTNIGQVGRALACGQVFCTGRPQ